MHVSAHVDTFVRDRLPPPSQWPAFHFDLPELQYPERLNCAVELLDRALERGWGERTAIITPVETLSYAQLAVRVNQLANWLVTDLGVMPGNRVLLHGPNGVGMAVGWFAVQKIAAVAVATMPLLRAGELAAVINKAQIAFALADARLADELQLARERAPVLERVLLFNTAASDGMEACMARMPDEFAAVNTAADDPSLIAFTSGTTGLPKGTVHMHRDVLAICDCFPPHILQPESEDVFIGTPPLAFTFGLGGLLLFPLRVGASTVLIEKYTPETLLQAIAQYRATICFTAPTFYRQMATMATRFDLTALKKTVSAGEALPAATRAAWRQATGIEMIDGIGATELLHIFISATPENSRAGATGKPVPGYRACVLDDNGYPLPPGEIGRLAVQGPTGCRYLDDVRQEKYVQNGWNLTGDAYSMDTDGYFWYHSRLDDMIITAGYNVAGVEVEGVLLGHPAVAECAVIGVPDEERGQIVKAYIVLQAGVSADAALASALQTYVKQQIAPYKYPRAIEFRVSLPRTETGKLQRFKLRQEESA